MPSRNPRALPPGLDPKAVPDHVAIVMDGNGRWAGAKGLPRNKGHEAGEAALFDTVEGGLDAGLSWLTVYAFSTENWRRPAAEVRFLMNFNESLLVRRSHELHDREVRIRFIGRRDRIPPHVRRRIEEAEELTAGDTRMTLAVALDYGGRDELARAVKALAAEVREGRGPRRIDERALARYLYQRVPDLELPALADRLRRAPLHPGPVARLQPPGAVQRPPRLPGPPPPLRRRRHPGPRGHPRARPRV